MKKGISTLVATVLVLGFTIAIAAVIMVWGQGYIGNMQKRADATTDTQLTCANDVLLDIADVCNSTSLALGGYKVTLKNDGTKAIDKVMLRFYESQSSVKTFDTVRLVPPGIGAFSVDTKLVTLTGVTSQIKVVEAVPVITIGDNQVTCAANIKKLGNFDNSQAWVQSC